MYARICERRIKEGSEGFAIMPNDYVFLPQIGNRGYPLKQLQRQFDAVLESLAAQALCCINLHTLIVERSGADGNTQVPLGIQKDAVGSQVLVLGMLFIPG